MGGLGGDDDHRQDGLEFLHHAKAIHLRHLHVQQDQVVAVGAVQGPYFLGVHGAADVAVAGVPEHLREQVHIGFLVVDDEDMGLEDFGCGNHGVLSFVVVGLAVCCDKASAASKACRKAPTLIGLVM